MDSKNATLLYCNDCGSNFYNNPKPAMSALFINDRGELLFGKRARDPEKGKYDFPGGFLEYGEDLFAATIREIKEEAGVDITRDDIILVSAYTLEYTPGITALDIILVIKKWSGDFRAADDVAALEWKPLSFIHDAAFRPDYPGLENKISSFLPS